MGDQQIPTNLLDLARYERRKRDCEKAERRLSLEEARDRIVETAMRFDWEACEAAVLAFKLLVKESGNG